MAESFQIVYAGDDDIYALFTCRVLRLSCNVINNQVVPQLGNGPEGEGAWPVLRMKSLLRVSQAPSLCLLLAGAGYRDMPMAWNSPFSPQ